MIAYLPLSNGRATPGVTLGIVHEAKAGGDASLWQYVPPIDGDENPSGDEAGGKAGNELHAREFRRHGSRDRPRRHAKRGAFPLWPNVRAMFCCCGHQIDRERGRILPNRGGARITPAAFGRILPTDTCEARMRASSARLSVLTRLTQCSQMQSREL